MQAAGGQPDDGIALLYRLAIDDALSLCHADDEPHQIVFPLGIDSGHLCGLATDEGTAHLAQGTGHPIDNAFHDLRLELAHGDVVMEEEGFGTTGEDVVDAVVNQVDTDGFVPPQGAGHFYLGPHAIGAGDENGLLIAS